MSFTTITPNMNLVVPVPGQEPGPQYASDLNASLTIVDSHNHTPGSGVAITPAALNINTNLNFQNNQAINLAGLIFSNPNSDTTPQSLYINSQSGGGIYDLFFNDGAGNVVALTKAGAVNATIASIPGESYAGGTFTWVQGAASTVPANFDIGSVTIRPNTAGTTNGITLQPPSGIASAYSLSLPALPAAQSFLTLDASGNIVPAANFASGLTTSNLSASANIIGTQLSASANILGTQLSASANVLGSQLSASANIAGTQLAAAANILTTQLANQNYSNSVSTLKTTVSLSGSATTICPTISISSGGTRYVMQQFYCPIVNPVVTFASSGTSVVQIQTTSGNASLTIAGTVTIRPADFSNISIGGAGTTTGVFQAVLISGSTCTMTVPATMVQNLVEL